LCGFAGLRAFRARGGAVELASVKVIASVASISHRDNRLPVQAGSFFDDGCQHLGKGEPEIKYPS
jgi:hypothetical protein